MGSPASPRGPHAQDPDGTAFNGVVRALGSYLHPFCVCYIAPMADFANWKPTNQKGEYDLKTFEVRLRSVQPIDGVRPGMTVLSHSSQQE